MSYISTAFRSSSSFGAGVAMSDDQLRRLAKEYPDTEA